MNQGEGVMGKWSNGEGCVYLATAGERLVGSGADLGELLARVGDRWEGNGGDVAVWQEGESVPARLVAVLRDSPLGYPRLTWLRPEPQGQPPELQTEEGRW
jgi:hypothetical protein